MTRRQILPGTIFTLALVTTCAAQFDFKKLQSSATAAVANGGLSKESLLEGKAALNTQLDTAATGLAKPGAVAVAPPESVAKLSLALAKTPQGAAAASAFGSTLSAAASKAAPEAMALVRETISKFTLQDAIAISAGSTKDAATAYLRRAAEPRLRTDLGKVMAKTTAAVGVPDKYKAMLALAGPLAASYGVPAVGDFDGYLAGKTLDTVFGAMAKSEMALRENPALSSNALVQQFYGAAKK